MRERVREKERERREREREKERERERIIFIPSCTRQSQNDAVGEARGSNLLYQSYSLKVLKT
jgi:hypothetical protein